MVSYIFCGFKMKENRTNPRYKIELKVTIKGIYKDFEAQTENLSENGIFLETTQKFPVNSFVEMCIKTHYFDKKIEVLGKVIHKKPKIGVGIEFIDYHDNSRELIATLISSLKDGDFH